MSHSHGHSHAHHLAGRRLALSLGLTLLFVIAELGSGLWSHSLSLVSDAGHNFADALALLLSLSGLRAASWPSSANRTFGYHRVGILAALINSASLVVISALILWQAAEHLLHPVLVRGPIMIGVALAAILINGLIATWLHRSAKDDLNIRSAYLHMLGDALAAFGVVVAGVIVVLTGSPLADRTGRTERARRPDAHADLPVPARDGRHGEREGVARGPVPPPLSRLRGRRPPPRRDTCARRDAAGDGSGRVPLTAKQT